MFLVMMLSCFGVYVCVCFGVQGKPQALFLQKPPTLFFRQDLMLLTLELLPLSPEPGIASMSFLAFYVGAGA